MTDRRKPEELTTDDLEQAVGGVQSTASSNPEGFKAGADLAKTAKKKATLKGVKEPKDQETQGFESQAGGSPNV